MAKKESRISVNKLESVIKENIVTVPMNGNEEVIITIRRTLPLTDMMQFVEDVVSSCVDTETAKYIPEVREFAMRMGILTMYANFNLPSNTEKQYDLLYRTDVVRQVMEHINRDQIYDIEEAIDTRIAHEVKMIETVLAAKTNEMMMRIENMVEQFEAAFGGINGDDFNGVVKKIVEMNGMTEESLAKAVLKVQGEANEDTDSLVVSFPKK